MLSLIRICLLGAAFLAVPLQATEPPASPRIAKLLAKTDGATQETAWNVRSVDEEHQIVRALGLEPKEQSLILDKDRAFDFILAADPSTGKTRELWFDISSFFGRMF